MKDTSYNILTGYGKHGILSDSESISGSGRVVVKDYDLFNKSPKDTVSVVDISLNTTENPTMWMDEASKKVLHNFKALLVAYGLEERFCNRLFDDAGVALVRDGNIDLDVFSTVLGQSINFGFIEYPHKMAFVGSSGVGKTTAIAKFALFAKTKLGKKVSLVTLDNYKISGARHLGKVGEMLKIPVYLARSSKDLILTLKDIRRSDLILIDTTGGNIQEFDRVRQFATWMDNYNATQSAKTALIRKVLLLPAGGNVFDLRKMVQMFSELKLNGLGITKADETCYFGPCLNTVLQHALPLNFITSGQNMENGIETGRRELVKKVVSLLFQTNMQVN